jgi:hypothetical protein
MAPKKNPGSNQVVYSYGVLNSINQYYDCDVLECNVLHSITYIDIHIFRNKHTSYIYIYRSDII